MDSELWLSRADQLLNTRLLATLVQPAELPVESVRSFSPLNRHLVLAPKADDARRVFRPDRAAHETTAADNTTTMAP